MRSISPLTFTVPRFTMGYPEFKIAMYPLLNTVSESWPPTNILPYGYASDIIRWNGGCASSLMTQWPPQSSYGHLSRAPRGTLKALGGRCIDFPKTAKLIKHSMPPCISRSWIGLHLCARGLISSSKEALDQDLLSIARPRSLITQGHWMVTANMHWIHQSPIHLGLIRAAVFRKTISVYCVLAPCYKVLSTFKNNLQIFKTR